MIADKELIDLLLHEKTDDLRRFDEQLGDCTNTLVAHVRRSYEKLEQVIAKPQRPGREHWSLAALYLWEAATSLMAAYGTLRQGYPIQALDLGRRLVEATAVAVWICDHPKRALDKDFTKVKPSACVSYAKRHMPNVGRSYGFSTLFDHAHSALMMPFRTPSQPTTALYQLGPLSVKERPGLFRLAALRLLSDSHNLEGVIEMLFYHGLEGAKRFWVEVETHIEYRPIPEEQECEKATLAALEGANLAFEAELMARVSESEEKKHAT